MESQFSKLEGIIYIELRYSYVKETKSERILVINESLFIETIESTIGKWNPFLIRSMYYDLEDIKIRYDLKTDFMKPLITIKLTKNYEIYHGYGVCLLLEDFIRGSLAYLIDNPIKLNSFSYNFTKRLEEKLQKLKDTITKDKLKND